MFVYRCDTNSPAKVATEPPEYNSLLDESLFTPDSPTRPRRQVTTAGRQQRSKTPVTTMTTPRSPPKTLRLKGKTKVKPVQSKKTTRLARGKFLAFSFCFLCSKL